MLWQNGRPKIADGYRNARSTLTKQKTFKGQSTVEKGLREGLRQSHQSGLRRILRALAVSNESGTKREQFRIIRNNFAVSHVIFLYWRELPILFTSLPTC